MLILIPGHYKFYINVFLNVLKFFILFAGIMPLWLFAYGNFLGLTYDRVTGPYFYIAGALLTLSGPLLVGLLIQRCSPRILPRMDRAILPTCALMLLVEIVINVINFNNMWELVTWRLLVGSSLVPVSGFVLGILTTATFKQKLPQIKTVSIVTAVQNTVLAKVIIQMSYPAADASVMAVTLSCVDFFTLALLVVTYLPHVCLWFCWPGYRHRHDHIGIGGLDHAIGETLVRSMIKAGEITFGKLQNSPKMSGTFDYPTLKPTLTLNTLHTLASLSGKHTYYANSEETHYKNQANKPGRSRPMTFPLNYFATSNRSPGSDKRSDKDSLEGIDYDMLMLSKGVLSASLDYDILMPNRASSEKVKQASVRSNASTVSSCVEKRPISNITFDMKNFTTLPNCLPEPAEPGTSGQESSPAPSHKNNTSTEILSDSGMSSDMSPTGLCIRHQWLTNSKSKWGSLVDDRTTPSPPTGPVTLSRDDIDLSSIAEELTADGNTTKSVTPEVAHSCHADDVGLLSF